MGHNDYDPFLSFNSKDVYFMRLHGQKIIGPNVEIIVIPRGNGEDIVFKARAVLNIDDFDVIYPPPKPPAVMKRGGEKSQDFNDKDYLKAMDQYGLTRWSWIVIQSLKATETLEWDLVDEKDPNTWHKWKQDLIESGFNFMELGRIEAGVMTANCLNETKLEEARQRFIHSQAQQPNQ